MCEDYVTELFSKSQLAAIHGGRVTVQPDDVQLVMNFRGDYLKFNKPISWEDTMRSTFMEKLKFEVQIKV